MPTENFPISKRKAYIVIERCVTQFLIQIFKFQFIMCIVRCPYIDNVMLLAFSVEYNDANNVSASDDNQKSGVLCLAPVSLLSA